MQEPPQPTPEFETKGSGLSAGGWLLGVGNPIQNGPNRSTVSSVLLDSFDDFSVERIEVGRRGRWWRFRWRDLLPVGRGHDKRNHDLKYSIRPTEMRTDPFVLLHRVNGDLPRGVYGEAFQYVLRERDVPGRFA